MTNKENSRQFIRSNIAIAARVMPIDLPSIDVMVIDLSLNGLLVEAKHSLVVGCKCSVEILIGHFMHELPLCAEGEIVRVHGDKIAIAFNAIGIEAKKEFQSMILFQSDTPEQCLQEFDNNKS